MKLSIIHAEGPQTQRSPSGNEHQQVLPFPRPPILPREYRKTEPPPGRAS